MLKEKQFKTFGDFTNLYELSKTLRFELRPTPETKDLLDKNKIIQTDKKIAENYQEIKKYFDKLHKKFIKEALSNTQIDFSDFCKLWEQNSKDSGKIKDLSRKLRKSIKQAFDKKGADWHKRYLEKGIKLKKKNLDILFEERVLDILKEEFKDDVDVKLFESFKGFSTYFTNFHESRKNFYKDDGTASAIATRIIDENLKRFCDNIKVKKHSKKLISELNEREAKIFEADFYNRCLLQQGIDDYNQVIGDINKKINNLRQNKIENTPTLKILYKQILGDVRRQETEQDAFIEIKNNEEVFDFLQDFIKHSDENNKYFKNLFYKFIEGKHSLDKIFLAKRFVNTISGKWFASWEVFGAELIKKFGNKKDLPDFIPFAAVKDVLQNCNIPANELFKEKIKNDEDKNIYDIFINLWKEEFDSNLKKVEESKKEVENMIAEDKVYSNKKEKRKNDNGEEIEIEIQKEKIKNYADAAMNIFRMMKYFLLEKNGKTVEGMGEDNNFYNELNIVFKGGEIDGKVYEGVKTYLYYNEFRNYLTKKPFNEEKTKLNFDCGQILSGWDKNKESEKLGVILRKDNKYYLAIINKKHNKIFDVKKNSYAYIVGDNFYEKMEYKLFPDAKRMIPKIAFAKNNKEKFGWTDEIQKIKNEYAEFQEGKKNDKNLWKDKFNKNKMEKLITYYQNCLEKGGYKDIYNFRWKSPDKYSGIGEFNDEIDRQSYCLKFVKVDFNYVFEKVKSGELYLFQIYNKDFSDKADRAQKENIHTEYFKLLFDQRNLDNVVLKLSGGAEIFYRPKTEGLPKKKDNKGNEVVRHRRYADDKYFLHLPIQLNFGRGNLSGGEFNSKINQYLSEQREIKIIGIDRGEKHLAYYSVINQDGKIEEIESLNTVNGIDYRKKLDELEKKREQERKSWQSISKIKDLKKGYISHVIKKICDLAIEHNAIIVFEDLSGGFKNSRKKIEKQIYQNLELALATKLNYLTFKDKNFGESGHYLNAYQLAPKIDNYQDIKMQTGIVFYTPAGYTSSTCPQCGFRKTLKFDYTATISKAEDLIRGSKLNIVFEKEKNRFKINYLFNPIEKKKKKIKENELFADAGAKNEFTIYSDVKRIKWHNTGTKRLEEAEGERLLENKNSRGRDKEYDINKCLTRLFRENKIDVNGDIIGQITKIKSLKLYQDLFYYLFLATLIRNNVSGSDIDYIQCPSCHFHSDGGFQKQKFNGDANGAYNIARKGILILKKIKQFAAQDKDMKNFGWKHLTVDINEWDKFTQK